MRREKHSCACVWHWFLQRMLGIQSNKDLMYTVTHNKGIYCQNVYCKMGVLEQREAEKSSHQNEMHDASLDFWIHCGLGAGDIGFQRWSGQLNSLTTQESSLISPYRHCTWHLAKDLLRITQQQSGGEKVVMQTQWWNLFLKAHTPRIEMFSDSRFSECRSNVSCQNQECSARSITRSHQRLNSSLK